MEKWLKDNERRLDILFYICIFAVLFGWMLIMPLGGGPDEKMRYSIVQYIFVHWRLPHGGDPEILDRTWGFSYAFQPILPYMISAVFVKLGTFFTWNGEILVLFARFVNIIIGIVMAVLTRKLSKKLFDKAMASWLFTLLVMLLPQQLFMHTYVNTDSMALMSTILIVYAWVLGMEKDWDVKSMVLLSLGIIFCAMSYYNAYGYILASIFVFASYFIILKEPDSRLHTVNSYKMSGRSNKDWIEGYMIAFSYIVSLIALAYDLKTGSIVFAAAVLLTILSFVINKSYAIQIGPMLKKGIFISAIVLLGIGWWFIRSYIMYDGDFLGLRIRDEYAEIYAVDALKPSLHETYYNQGHSIMYMLKNSNFLVLTAKSFVAMFGNMEVGVYDWIYRGYLLLIITGIAGMLIPERQRSYLRSLSDRSVKIININMILCAVIPNILNIWAAYSYDYQPQGRYSLPMLAALMYLVSIGLNKIVSFFIGNKKVRDYILAGVCAWLVIACLVCLRMFVIPMYL